jgi:hypothetical protein
MPSAPVIVITGFQGEQPHIIPRLMPETAAQSAFDVRLDDGGLTPFRESVFRSPAAATNWKTIYKYLDTWIGWANDVDCVPAPVDEDRIYYTGDGVPKMRTGTSVYNLAVPRPLTKLTAAKGGTGSGDIQSRQYIYTYVTEIPVVNGIQEESEPSPVSNLIDWQPGNTVTLSGFTLPTGPARGVVYQRIYRLQTGAAGTYFYLIAQRGVTAADYVDSIAVDATAEPCPSIAYNAPPDTLLGLTALPNGMMAAFDGKKLYFSEPYKPHAWPEKYIITVDYEIVALGAMGMTLLVATKGQPYVVAGTQPDSMASQKLEQNLPCIGKRTLVDLGYAVAYASNEGVVVARADGSVGVATSNIFSRHDWAAMTPETMIGAQYNGRYCAFYDTPRPDGSLDRGALLIDLSGQSFLLRAGTTAQAALYDVVESALFYVPTGKAEIRQLDAPGALSKYLYWKSKEFVLPYPESYGAFLIDGIVNPETTSPDIVANQIAATIDANNIAMKTRYPNGQLMSIGGDLNGTFDENLIVVGEKMGGEDCVPMSGDWLLRLPRGAVVTGANGDSTATAGQTTVSVGIYADKKLLPIFITEVNKPVRLPSGFKARTWEIDVHTNGRIFRFTLAKTMDDLKRQP